MRKRARFPRIALSLILCLMLVCPPGPLPGIPLARADNCPPGMELDPTGASSNVCQMINDTSSAVQQTVGDTEGAISQEWNNIQNAWDEASDNPLQAAGDLAWSTITDGVALAGQLIQDATTLVFNLLSDALNFMATLLISLLTMCFWPLYYVLPWCPQSGNNDSGPSPPSGATPGNYCLDSTGTPITDLATAQKCCDGAPQYTTTPPTPHAGCTSNYPAADNNDFPTAIFDASQRVANELGIANTLLGGQGANVQSGDSAGSPPAQTTQATAGQVMAGPGAGPGSASGGGGGGSGGSNPRNRSGRGGGGSGFGGSGQLGSLTTAPTPGGSGGAGDASTAGADAGSTYSSGGGDGAGGGGRGDGSGGGVSLSGVPAVVDFGASADADSGQQGAEVKPMGSEDPDDYFSRTSPKDNLFKIVERRYRKISIGWAEEDLRGKVDRLKSPPPKAEKTSAPPPAKPVLK